MTEILAYEKQIFDVGDDIEIRLKAANTYVQQYPSKGRPYAIRSMIYAKLNRTDEQISDLDDAIRLLSKDPIQAPMLLESIYGRGLAYQALGDDLAALPDFDRVLKLEPNYASALQARAFSYLRQSKFDDALQDADAAIATEPDNPRAYQLRGLIRERLSDLVGADADFAEHRRLSGK